MQGEFDQDFKLVNGDASEMDSVLDGGNIGSNAQPKRSGASGQRRYFMFNDGSLQGPVSLADAFIGKNVEPIQESESESVKNTPSIRPVMRRSRIYSNLSNEQSATLPNSSTSDPFFNTAMTDVEKNSTQEKMLDIHQMLRQHQKETSEASLEFQKVFEQQMAKLQSLQQEMDQVVMARVSEHSTMPPPIMQTAMDRPQLQAPVVERDHSARLPQHFSASISRAVSNSNSNATMYAHLEQVSVPMEPQIDVRASLQQMAASPIQAKQNLTRSIGDLSALVDASYLTLKGRLRLGTLRSRTTLVFGALLSLNLSLLTWGRQCHEELHWHLTSEYSKKGLRGWFLIVIPLLHWWALYKLAKEIIVVERQNGYQSVSQLSVFVLGFVPPLAAAYLQSRINRHWRLHVQNIKSTIS